MAAVDWPTLEELKQRLDVTSTDWDGDSDVTRLTRLLDAAIAHTKARKGDWVEDYDQPDEALAQSALELAIEYASTGEVPASPKSKALLYGQRRRFGIG